MTPKEKRKLKSELHNKLMKIICEDATNDEEFFLNLIYAQEIIAHELTVFDDIYDDKE